MWQNLSKPLNFLRGLLIEYHKISYLRTSAAVINNNQQQQQQQQQLKANSTSVETLQLVTAYSGYSKDYYYSNGQVPTINKKKLIFGDDSLFTASTLCADVLGIADGVGGWREMGVDPSKFSSNLMKQCKRIVEQETQSTFSDSKQITSQTPLDILINSYNALLENKDPTLIGSSTACIIVFNRESKYLYTANLGDSGYVIIRNNKIVHRSQEQYHYFNAPFQMAILPMQSNDQEEDHLFNDSPKSASINSFELAEGDFIVMATDGLWDNLSEGALLLKISNIKSFSLHDLEKAAKNISSYAAELAKDPDYMSPFAISAQKYGIDFKGGKPDDITVLLARVTRS